MKADCRQQHPEDDTRRADIAPLPIPCTPTIRLYLLVLAGKDRIFVPGEFFVHRCCLAAT